MKKEYLYAATSIVCWSTVPVISKLLLGTFTNIQLLWVSSFFAGSFLLIVNAITGNLKKLKTYTLKDVVTTVLIGFPGTFLYYIFYYAGTAVMPASQAFIVNYLWPIMSIIFACIILKEQMTAKKILAVVISFVGVGIVMFGDLAGIQDNTLTGVLFCTLGAISYGVFTALNKKYRYDKRLSMMMNCYVTFTLTTITNFLRGDLFLPQGMEIVGMAWNGIFTMGLATTSWAMALEIGKTERISNLAYITPFLSLIWTSIFLKEPFHARNLLGMAVIVLGVLIQFKEKKSVGASPESGK